VILRRYQYGLFKFHCEVLEVFTAVNVKITFFQNIKTCINVLEEAAASIFRVEDGSTRFL
jgi:hypothetical protein